MKVEATRIHPKEQNGDTIRITDNDWREVYLRRSQIPSLIKQLNSHRKRLESGLFNEGTEWKSQIATH